MRLTNRGRVVGGIAVTGVVLLANHAVNGSPPSAAAVRRPVVAASPVLPTPSVVTPNATTPNATTPNATTPTPSPTASPSPTAPPTTTSNPAGGSASPAPISGVGLLVPVIGASSIGGSGSLRRYPVEVESGLGEDRAAFAAAVQSTLIDRRSWGAGLSFQRVDSGPVAFTVVLASRTSAEVLCQPLQIQYRLSCFQQGRAVIKDDRWRDGADAYAGHLAEYRLYVINHEVGHALGHHHEYCGGAGQPAPVMMQQTKGIGACRANPWVHPAA